MVCTGAEAAATRRAISTLAVHKLGTHTPSTAANLPVQLDYVVALHRTTAHCPKLRHVARVIVGVDQVGVDGQRRLDVAVAHQLRDVDRRFKSDSTNDNSAGGEPHNHHESSANRAFASCRSAVSNPSVNQS